VRTPAGVTATTDAVVVGGGFYGCVIAAYLRKSKGLRSVMLVERASALMTRASYNNQARIHNGYHYPRSFTTAYRSRVNLPRFVQDWPDAVKTDFTNLYAIARRNSKVTAQQFKKFCKEIGARLEPADATQRRLFEPRLIEDVFIVQEYAFDASKVTAFAEAKLRDAGVDVRTGVRALRIDRGQSSGLQVCIRPDGEGEQLVSTRFVFNCSYSGLNQLEGEDSRTSTQLKHEIAEMALVRLPREMESLGITVMDGSFFSVMPFPARGLHTLSHVRYTPHLHWKDEAGVNPYQRLAEYGRPSRFDRMIRDAGRYLPSLSMASYVESLFEVKTVLAKNEVDDGRPILFEQSSRLPGYYSVLGGKIDNIYDVMERLETVDLASGELPTFRQGVMKS